MACAAMALHTNGSCTHDHNVMSRDQGKVPDAMPNVKIALKVA